MFQVGDEVIVHKSYSGWSRRPQNPIGRILAVNDVDDAMLAIEFYEWIDGHSCMRLGRHGFCWNIGMYYVDKFKTNKRP